MCCVASRKGRGALAAIAPAFSDHHTSIHHNEEDLMNRITFFSAALLALFSTALSSMPAQAQASRTWVSGVGNDADPCSRTAPCKTFAGAISKTAAGGEIDVLDPGGFGAVTLTKSITLDGGGGQVASILTSGGTSGVVVSGAGIVVILRNLSLQGITSGSIGVNIQNAGRVMIEHCNIQGFTTYGVNFGSSASGSFLTIANSVIHDNPGYGVVMLPATSGAASLVTLDNDEIEHNGIGMFVGDNTKATATRTIVSTNTAGGITVDGASVLALLELDDSSVSNNAGNGLSLLVTSGHPIVRLSNTSILANTGNSMSVPVGADVVSFGTNRIVDNGTDTLPGGTVLLH
jgi:hypothetical protein